MDASAELANRSHTFGWLVAIISINISSHGLSRSRVFERVTKSRASKGVTTSTYLVRPCAYSIAYAEPPNPGISLAQSPWNNQKKLFELNSSHAINYSRSACRELRDNMPYHVNGLL